MVDWKGRRRKRSWPTLREYPNILLEGLRKAMNKYSEPLSPEYQAEMTTVTRSTSAFMPYLHEVNKTNA